MLKSLKLHLSKGNKLKNNITKAEHSQHCTSLLQSSDRDNLGSLLLHASKNTSSISQAASDLQVVFSSKAHSSLNFTTSFSDICSIHSAKGPVISSMKSHHLSCKPQAAGSGASMKHALERWRYGGWMHEG